MSCFCPCSPRSKCFIPRSCSPGWCDESYISRKDHLYHNARFDTCSWNPRFDDQFWNTKEGAPKYCTRFDAPSPVKPPWCPPGCKTRSYLYPRFYKKNPDGWYPDECRCQKTCRIMNPSGTGPCENSCGIKKWSIPLCPQPLCGRSRCCGAPQCCGCVPSPACSPFRTFCSTDDCCCCPRPAYEKCGRRASCASDCCGAKFQKCNDSGRCFTQTGPNGCKMLNFREKFPSEPNLSFAPLCGSDCGADIGHFLLGTNNFGGCNNF